jgi:hypothetical protein
MPNSAAIFRHDWPSARRRAATSHRNTGHRSDDPVLNLQVVDGSAGGGAVVAIQRARTLRTGRFVDKPAYGKLMVGERQIEHEQMP